MTPKAKAHSALIFTSCLFGANYWIAKSIMPALSPYQVVFFRISIACLLFWTFSLFIQPSTISKRDKKSILLSGVLGVTLNQLFFFKGLEYSTPVETSILHTLSPLLIALFAIIIIKEKVSNRKIIGVLSGLLGAFIIVSSGKNITLSDLNFKGNIFILINITSYSLYIILIKPMMTKYNAIQVLKYVFLGGAITYLPLSFFLIPEFSFGHLNTNEWLALFYVIIGTTIITYFLTVFAMKRLLATAVGFYIYLQPFVTSSIGFISGKELLTIPKIIAAIFLFIGIWLVITEKKKKEQH